MLCSRKFLTACNLAAAATIFAGATPALGSFACCDSTTYACILKATGETCNGTSGAEGSTCSPNPCPAPPNDLCAGAIALSIGTTITGYNNSATADTLITCGGFTNHTAGVWYTFTASNNHRYEVSTCGATAPTTNTRVVVFSTTTGCGGLACVGLSSLTTCTGTTNAAAVAFCATTGTTYYALVSTDAAGSGTYPLTLSDLGDVCPPNDVCATAIPIVLGSSTPGNNVYASNDTNPGSGTCNGQSAFNKSVWYKYIDTSATPMRLRADLCDPATDFDAMMYVYKSTTGCTGPMTCVWANLDSGIGCPNQSASMSNTNSTHSKIPSVLNWTPRVGSEPLVTKCTTVTLDGNNNVIPTTYYILVCSQSTTVSGNFVLHLEDTGESCSNADGIAGHGTPPSHNTCAGARTLSSFPHWDDVYPYDAMDLAPDVSCDDPALTTASRAGLWYTFTPSVPGNFFYAKIPDEGASTTNTDSVLTIYTAAPDCSALTDVGCSSAADGFLTKFTNSAAHLNAGTTYYFQVSAFNITPQAWYLGFNFVADPGACCTASVCSITNTAGDCTGGGGTYQGAGSVCSPDPCAAPLNGACCRGSTCVVETSANCIGANSSYSGNGTVCNAPGNNTTPCCKADYNQSGAVSVQDIFDFLSGYFTASPYADVNGSGAVSVQDIFDFLSAYFTGC